MHACIGIHLFFISFSPFSFLFCTGWLIFFSLFLLYTILVDGWMDGLIKLSQSFSSSLCALEVMKNSAS